jgi:hypothetical protein
MRKLLAPNTRAIGRPTGPPSCDAVPASMIDGTPTKLRDDLVRILGDKQVLHRLIKSLPLPVWVIRDILSARQARLLMPQSQT